MNRFMPGPAVGMSKVTAAALAAAVLLVGCAAAPTDAAPPATVPRLASQWQAPLPHGGAATELARWWSQFNDPVLTDLQAAAQQASPSLVAARARIQRARATLTGAQAANLPRLDAVGSASTGRQVPGQAVSRSASLGLQARWEQDILGAIGLSPNSDEDAAQARLEGAQAGWHDARVTLAAEVASNYTALRACEAQLVQSRLDVGSRSETARLTEQSAQAGFTAPADAALVRAGVAQTRSQMRVTQTQCEVLVKGLVEVTDLAETDLRQRLAPGHALLPRPAALAVSGLPAALLAQRPDLAEAARNVAAAAADQALSQAHERPQVSLSGSWAGVRLSGGDNPGSRGATWSVGPLVVSFPLFDAGARAAATQAARVDYDNAVAQYQAVARRAVREVETALVTLDTTAQREVDALAAARGFEAALVATQARQRGGLASLLDLEAARRNALQAQSALIELQRERAAAWISLYRALGGGWAPTSLAATTAVAPAKPADQP
jgi:outer membrane protein, multidrug efflux system